MFFNSPPIDNTGSILPFFASVAIEPSFCLFVVLLPTNKKGTIIYGTDEIESILHNSAVLIDNQLHK
ncbi:hypothetical protein, partial [Enterococcus casseliflavus]|uniref:hypothetical protein n=1 Tax=Enterococcus casseliflavus TaxID=37734 RepID=UPI003D6BA06B